MLATELDRAFNPECDIDDGEPVSLSNGIPHHRPSLILVDTHRCLHGQSHLVPRCSHPTATYSDASLDLQRIDGVHLLLSRTECELRLSSVHSIADDGHLVSMPRIFRLHGDRRRHVLLPRSSHITLSRVEPLEPTSMGHGVSHSHHDHRRSMDRCFACSLACIDRRRHPLSSVRALLGFETIHAASHLHRARLLCHSCTVDLHVVRLHLRSSEARTGKRVHHDPTASLSS